MEEREEIPGSILRDDRPYETIEERDDTPGLIGAVREDKP
jgi:hypothetical protein